MEMMIPHNSRFPFTSSQWQELEHQALVYKYLISGIPIPPHFLFSIQTSFDSSLIHSPHQSIGWEYFQMGLRGKIDPEPGRCRRTDGKKWRCSKEAFRDSKYCERHMHRGRNRSRKHVEASLSINSTSNTIGTSSSAGDHVLSSQDRFSLESSPYPRSEKDRSSGTISASVGDSWFLEPLAVNNSSSSVGNHLYQQLQNSLTRRNQDQGRCYDLKIEAKDESHKVMHHFFDESPHRENDDRSKDKDSSTTQLSISIPSCGQDLLTCNGNFTS